MLLATAVVVPVVINKATETHFKWVKPHLRIVFAAILALLSLQALWKAEVYLQLNRIMDGAVGYALCALVGASFGCWYWWLAGLIFQVKMDLTFSGSELMTNRRKALISKEFGRSQEYLKEIGFELPAIVAPVQISTFPNAGYLTTPNNPYGDSLMFSEQTVDSDQEIRSLYLSYIFKRLLEVSKYDMAKHVNRWESSSLIARYYENSLAGQQLQKGRWDDTLWDLRRVLGRESTDKMLLYVVKLFDQPGADVDGDFDHF